MTLFTFLTSLGCTAILERQEWSQSLATCQKNHMIKPRLKSQTFGLPLPWVIIFCFPLVYLSHSETHNFESVCHEFYHLSWACFSTLNTFSGDYPKMPDMPVISGEEN